jgi:hypothetical protein
MAWRIDENVIRGEVDNREKGIVRGRLWFEGLVEPVELELKGNAHPDLAGCLLKFSNTKPPIALRKDAKLFPLQEGAIGDLTASRKVRVFDIPLEEAYQMLKQGGKPPEHMANCLYLEWFSPRNGRVVIESVDYLLEISAPEWRMTAEEDEQRAKEAAANFSDFLKPLNDRLDAAKHQTAEDKEWNEFDYEKFLRESDARTDKYMELLDKYGDDEAAEELIAKEMGWKQDQEGEETEGVDDEAEEGEEPDWDVEEINRITAEALEDPLVPDPATEGVDWIRTADDDIRHPLQHRCFESAMKFWHKCDELGLRDIEDEDLVQLTMEFQITSAKLAGALNDLAYGRDSFDPPFVVACLKRALNHLHKAQAGLERTAAKNIAPAPVLAETRDELFAIREGILQLMDDFRRQDQE